MVTRATKPEFLVTIQMLVALVMVLVAIFKQWAFKMLSLCQACSLVKGFSCFFFSFFWRPSLIATWDSLNRMVWQKSRDFVLNLFQCLECGATKFGVYWMVDAEQRKSTCKTSAQAIFYLQIHTYTHKLY